MAYALLGSAIACPVLPTSSFVSAYIQYVHFFFGLLRLPRLCFGIRSMLCPFLLLGAVTLSIEPQYYPMLKGISRKAKQCLRVLLQTFLLSSKILQQRLAIIGWQNNSFSITLTLNPHVRCMLSGVSMFSIALCRTRSLAFLPSFSLVLRSLSDRGTNSPLLSFSPSIPSVKLTFAAVDTCSSPSKEFQPSIRYRETHF